ncbi:hypothetical protein [Oceanicoccus sp. KOV_DT_Chl]|uniref:hypothetical protein n=1 Tax=Oceanicoccus sp. KOV_DT_Chl TaxID=1904639 RepID=UPI000C7D80AA|nr:hypothetical protein [Oceanicoccus sp. KOV_DT_Chl]
MDRRYISLLALITLFVGLVSAEPIVIGGVPDKMSPPYHWVNPCTNVLEGGSIHLLRKSLEMEGYEVLVAPPIKTDANAWAEFDRQVATEKIHIMPTMYSPPLPGITISSSPLAWQKDSIVHRKGDTSITHDAADLDTYKGIMQHFKGRGTKHAVYKNLKAKGYDIEALETDTLAALQKIISKEADYLVIDYYHALIIARQHGIENQLNFGSWPRQDVAIHAGVKTHSKWEAPLQAIDKHLAMFNSKGLTNKVMSSYLQRFIEQSTQCAK